MALHELNLRPTRRDLRRFGFIALAGYGLLGAFVYFKRSFFGLGLGEWATALAALLWAVAVLSALFSLIFPAANRPLYVLMTVLTFPIGYVVSHLLLALFFFGVLTPLGLVFRLIGRDPLRRKFEPQAASYWEPHDTPESAARYFRQF